MKRKVSSWIRRLGFEPLKVAANLLKITPPPPPPPHTHTHTKKKKEKKPQTNNSNAHQLQQSVDNDHLQNKRLLWYFALCSRPLSAAWTITVVTNNVPHALIGMSLAWMWSDEYILYAECHIIPPGLPSMTVWSLQLANYVNDSRWSQSLTVDVPTTELLCVVHWNIWRHLQPRIFLSITGIHSGNWLRFGHFHSLFSFGDGEMSLHCDSPSLTHPLNDSLTDSITPSLTPSLTHSLTHSLRCVALLREIDT